VNMGPSSTGPEEGHGARRREDTAPSSPVVGAPGILPRAGGPAHQPVLAPTPTFIVWDEDPWAVKNILGFIGEKVQAGPANIPVRLLLPSFELPQDIRAEREAFAREIIEPATARSDDARLAYLNFRNREEQPGITDLEALLLDQLAVARQAWNTPVAISYLPLEIPAELKAAESSTRQLFERLRTPAQEPRRESPDTVRSSLLDAVRTEMDRAVEGNRALTKILKDSAQEAIAYYSTRGERVFVLLPRLTAEAIDALPSNARNVVAVRDSGAVEDVGTRPAVTSPFADAVRNGLLGRAITEEDAERRLLICGARWAIQRTLPPATFARASFRDLEDDRLQTDIATCARHVVAQMSGEIVRRVLTTAWSQISTLRPNASIASVLADALSMHVTQASGSPSSDPAQQQANVAKLHDRAREWLSR